MYKSHMKVETHWFGGIRMLLDKETWQKSRGKDNIPMDLESSVATKHMAGSLESCYFYEAF